ncbi:ABC transporter ATP-binding protein [Nocardioides endophyticus]|uniref:ABC transporter ATP-binding protein n=1 Tax=Nocardioides endophyticus TaxID=1353775 RepID=UPI003CD0AA99
MSALDRAALEIPEGAVVAVLGNNGAGKTTLLRVMSGTHRLHGGEITGGQVFVGETPIGGLNPRKIVAHGVIQVPEGRRIFSRLTVEENLRVGGIRTRDRRSAAEARARVFDLFPILADRRHQRAGLMSGGEQQMLAIGRALMASPRVLLLDEPSLGLAPLVVEQIAHVITEINRQGTSVLLVEQNAEVALGVATHAYVLELGRVVLSGPASELRNSPAIRQLYLGDGAPLGDEVADGPRPVLAPWDFTAAARTRSRKAS